MCGGLSGSLPRDFHHDRLMVKRSTRVCGDPTALVTERLWIPTCWLLFSFVHARSPQDGNTLE